MLFAADTYLNLNHTECPQVHANMPNIQCKRACETYSNQPMLRVYRIPLHFPGAA